MPHTRLAGRSNARRAIPELCFTEASPLKIERERMRFYWTCIALMHNLTIGPRFGTDIEMVFRSSFSQSVRESGILSVSGAG
jgi:hypothetical protein